MLGPLRHHITVYKGIKRLLDNNCYRFDKIIQEGYLTLIIIIMIQIYFLETYRLGISKQTMSGCCTLYTEVNADLKAGKGKVILEVRTIIRNYVNTLGLPNLRSQIISLMTWEASIRMEAISRNKILPPYYERAIRVMESQEWLMKYMFRTDAQKAHILTKSGNSKIWRKQYDFRIFWTGNNDRKDIIPNWTPSFTTDYCTIKQILSKLRITTETRGYLNRDIVNRVMETYYGRSEEKGGEYIDSVYKGTIPTVIDISTREHKFLLILKLHLQSALENKTLYKTLRNGGLEYIRFIMGIMFKQ